jgi:predicted small secreted protein
MKKKLIFSFILFFLLLTGCNGKGEYDIKGTVMEVEHSSILVEDDKLGLIWLSLPDGTEGRDFEKGQSVAVWTDGKIRESYPLQGTALNIEVIK